MIAVSCLNPSSCSRPNFEESGLIAKSAHFTFNTGGFGCQRRGVVILKPPSVRHKRSDDLCDSTES